MHLGTNMNNFFSVVVLEIKRNIQQYEGLIPFSRKI